MSDDCISRQAVETLVDELARAISDERCCMSRGRSTATIMQDILDLSSVNPQPKTGHWIEHRSRATGHIESICSECGAEEGYPYNDYCGNCGSKMEVSDDRL